MNSHCITWHLKGRDELDERWSANEGEEREKVKWNDKLKENHRIEERKGQQTHTHAVDTYVSNVRVKVEVKSSKMEFHSTVWPIESDVHYLQTSTSHVPEISLLDVNIFILYCFIENFLIADCVLIELKFEGKQD